MSGLFFSLSIHYVPALGTFLLFLHIYSAPFPILLIPFGDQRQKEKVTRLFTSSASSPVNFSHLCPSPKDCDSCLLGGSFHRATQRRFSVSVTTPSFALPDLEALITACYQSQTPDLSLLVSLNQVSQSGLHIRTRSHVQAECWTSTVHQKYNLSYACILKFSARYIIKTQGSPLLSPTSLLRRLPN